MSWKRLIVGEPMPDKNDPKYMERYEREVEAGRQFADKAGISWVARRLQEIGQAHKVAFLIVVFGFVTTCFFVNVYRMVTAYQQSGQSGVTAVERVDSALESHGHYIKRNSEK